MLWFLRLSLMSRLVTISVISGLIAGLLVGGFHNLFTVPVMERAIALEETRAVTEAPSPAGGEVETPVSLGVQRVGMVVGTGIYGLILGLVFSGGYALLRRVQPGWQPLALAATVGILGFWAISLFPFVKFPVNPPGVGEGDTLLFRQQFQTIFLVLSAFGIVVLLVGWAKINSLAVPDKSRTPLRAALALGYGVFAAALVFGIPGNPDPVPVPVDLLELFRALTMAGQFLLWGLLAAGVTLALNRLKLGEPREAPAHPSPAGV